MDLEGLGVHLGKGLGRPGPTFVHFWVLFGTSKLSFFQALGQDGLQEAFWIDLGRLLDAPGRILAAFWASLGYSWACLGTS